MPRADQAALPGIVLALALAACTTAPASPTPPRTTAPAGSVGESAPPPDASASVSAPPAAWQREADAPELAQPHHGHGAAVVDDIFYVLLGGPEPTLSAGSTIESLRVEGLAP